LGRFCFAHAAPTGQLLEASPLKPSPPTLFDKQLLGELNNIDSFDPNP